MAKPWSQVVASPEFQQLDANQRNQAQNAYFDSVVKPQLHPRDYGAARAEFYQQFPEATSGAGGAFGATVSRLESGAEKVLGMDEQAAQDLRESQRYVPTVSSYKDIRTPSDFVSYVTENVAGSSPYLAGLVAAPFVAAAAPEVAGIGAVGLGIDAIVGAAEGGARYQEQPEGDKSWARAIGSGVGEQLMFRGAGKAGELLHPAARFGMETVGVPAAQHMSQQMVGYGQSFDEATKNIDESIMGGVTGILGAKLAQRGVMKAQQRARQAQEARLQHYKTIKDNADTNWQHYSEIQQKTSQAQGMLDAMEEKGIKQFDTTEEAKNFAAENGLNPDIVGGFDTEGRRGLHEENVKKAVSKGESMLNTTGKDLHNATTMQALGILNEAGAKFSPSDLAKEPMIRKALGVSKAAVGVSKTSDWLREKFPLPLGDLLGIGKESHAKANTAAINSVVDEFMTRSNITEATEVHPDLDYAIRDYIMNGTKLSEADSHQLGSLSSNMVPMVEALRKAKELVDTTSGYKPKGMTDVEKGAERLRSLITLGIGTQVPLVASAGRAGVGMLAAAGTKASQKHISKALSQVDVIMQGGKGKVSVAELKPVLAALQAAQSAGAGREDKDLTIE